MSNERDAGGINFAEWLGEVLRGQAGDLKGSECLLAPLTDLFKVVVELGEVGRDGGEIGLRVVGAHEIGFGRVGATLKVGFEGGVGEFGMLGAEFGIGEIEVFGGAEEAEIRGHFGERFAVAEVLEDAGLDAGADGTEEGIGIEFVADVGGGGDLGEDGLRWFGIVLGIETAERGAGGDEVEAAFGARSGENFGDFGVAVPRAEVEDVFAVGFGKFGELVLRFLAAKSV